MKGSIPIAGDDFIDSSNGFKFGVGLNNPTGDEDILTLSIEKAKGGGNVLSPDTWQIQLEDYDPVMKCLQSFKGDMVAYYVDFLNRAHAKIKAITGSGIPAWPENDLNAQLKWLIENGTSFSAAGFKVTGGKG